MKICPAQLLTRYLTGSVSPKLGFPSWESGYWFLPTLLLRPACLLNSSRISMQIVRLVSGIIDQSSPPPPPPTVPADLWQPSNIHLHPHWSTPKMLTQVIFAALFQLKLEAEVLLVSIFCYTRAQKPPESPGHPHPLPLVGIGVMCGGLRAGGT